MPGHTKCCTCHAKSSQQTWRSNAPKCNLLRKSVPGLPNSSDEHVSCTAPATENASLQILFKSPRLPSFLEMRQNLHVLLTFNTVHNPLRLPRETTSERQKVVRACGVFIIFTSKCASRHNGLHFFDISTSKSGPNLVCFVHFDFEMCFAPQQRAIFHLSSGQLALFDPPEPQIIGETQCFTTFLPFRAPGSSFFWGFLLHLDLLSSETFSFFFSFLLFSSLTLPISAFHLSILSEVWLLNFLRLAVDLLPLDSGNVNTTGHVQTGHSPAAPSRPPRIRGTKGGKKEQTKRLIQRWQKDFDELAGSCGKKLDFGLYTFIILRPRPSWFGRSEFFEFSITTALQIKS